MDYEQWIMALNRISITMFKESEALQKLYDYIGINDQVAFKNKLKLLRIPFSFKQAKKPSFPPSNYQFKFFAHGGKLAD